jgi:hypothetical protein
MYIDHSVYPDLDDPPTVLETDFDKADYVHRICTAWDFHILPETETFALLAAWKDIFDRFPIPTSPGYHAFRMKYGWEPVAPVPGLPAPTPLYVHLDRLEGRDADPCEKMI